MLEVNKVRDEFENILKVLEKRGISDIKNKLQDLIKLDDQRKSLKSEIDKINNESNIISKDIGIAFKSGKDDNVESLKLKSQELKEKSKIINDNLKETENKLRLSLYSIPNTPDHRVPEGKSDKENKIIFSSDISKNETLKPHWDIIKEFQIIDFELGNNITGAGFPVYIGKGAILQRALINYFLDVAREKDYTEIQPPFSLMMIQLLTLGSFQTKKARCIRLRMKTYTLSQLPKFQ